MFNPLGLLLRSTTTRRQKVLRWLTLLILVNTVAVAALLIVDETHNRDRFYSAMIRQRVERTESTLRAFFRPITACLSLARAWGEAGVLNLEAPDSVYQKFAPLLQYVPQLSSLQISSRDRSVILERRESEWTVSTRAGQAFGLDTTWYRDAVANPGEPQWGVPQLLELEQVRGVTEAISWHGQGGLIIVAAVSFPIRALSDVLRNLELAEEAEVLWVSSGVLYRLSEVLEGEPGAPGGDRMVTGVLEGILVEAEEGASSYSIGGERWWLGVYSSVVEDRSVKVAVAVPERILEKEAGTRGRPLVYVLLGLLALGLAAWVGLSRSYAESAPEASGLRGLPPKALLEEIHRGESERLEFKSTMRWNLHKDRPGKEVEISWLKTLAAFMNSGGGTLLIGVGDHGELLGIEADRFDSEDKFLLHFNNLIREHIGLEFSSLIGFEIRVLDDRKILAVDCRPSDAPVFLKKGNVEEFYVRVGPGSRQLSPSQMLEYVNRR